MRLVHFAAGALVLLPAIGLSQTEWNSNGHFYQVISSPTKTWAQAKADAESRVFLGGHGYLVTVTSPEEQAFLNSTFGTTIREKFTGGIKVNDAWTWVTGEPFDFTNWAPGEPSGDGGAINFHGANDLGTWNDVPETLSLGYIVEYPSPLILKLNKKTVAGQNSVQGTVIIPEAVANNTVVQLSDNSTLVTTPASTTIAAGQTLKNFQITTVAINSSIVTQIRAKLGTITRNVTLTLSPLVPTAMAFTPNPVVGGNPVSCRLIINGVAGPGGRTVAVFDNSPFTTMPSTVIVPPGGTEVIFTIATTHPTTVQTVTVTARVSAGEKTSTFRINP